MSKELDDLKFVLTGKMTYILLKINNLKKKISLIDEQMKTYKNTIHYHSLNNSKQILKQELADLKLKFIKEFRKENKVEIDTYLKLKDKL